MEALLRFWKAWILAAWVSNLIAFSTWMITGDYLRALGLQVGRYYKRRYTRLSLRKMSNGPRFTVARVKIYKFNLFRGGLLIEKILQLIKKEKDNPPIKIYILYIIYYIIYKYIIYYYI